MSYYYNRLALIELIQILHDASLVVGIKRVGCFVKENVVWILIDSSCYKNALLLPLAQSYAITPNLGIKLQWQSHHVILNASYLGSFQQTFLVYVAIINSNVSSDTFREDDTILHNNTMMLSITVGKEEAGAVL